jgi:hypothetical protein
MILALTILIALFTGLYLGRYGEQRTQSRFSPVPTSIRCHVRYIEGDEATELRKAGL